MVKLEKLSPSPRKKNDGEIKQDQLDTSCIIASSEDTKTSVVKTNSDVNSVITTDSNNIESQEVDAETKESDVAVMSTKVKEVVNAEEVQPNETDVDEITCQNDEAEIDNDTNNQDKSKELEVEKIITASIDIKNTENVIEKKESKELKQIKMLEKLGTGIEVKEEFTELNGDLQKSEIKNLNDNNINVVKESEVTPEADVDDEDNIQDEELDHEVDEEEIKGSIDVFNQTDDTVSLLNLDHNYYKVNLF